MSEVPPSALRPSWQVAATAMLGALLGIAAFWLCVGAWPRLALALDQSFLRTAAGGEVPLAAVAYVAFALVGALAAVHLLRRERQLTRGLNVLLTSVGVLTAAFCTATIASPFGPTAGILWFVLQALGPASLLLSLFELLFGRRGSPGPRRLASIPMTILGALGAVLASASWLPSATVESFAGTEFNALRPLRVLTVAALVFTFALWWRERSPRRGAS